MSTFSHQHINTLFSQVLRYIILQRIAGNKEWFFTNINVEVIAIDGISSFNGGGQYVHGKMTGTRIPGELAIVGHDPLPDGTSKCIRASLEIYRE